MRRSALKSQFIRKGALDGRAGAEFLPGNRIDLLETGNDYFPALIAGHRWRAARDLSRNLHLRERRHRALRRRRTDAAPPGAASRCACWWTASVRATSPHGLMPELIQPRRRSAGLPAGRSPLQPPPPPPAPAAPQAGGGGRPRRLRRRHQRHRRHAHARPDTAALRLRGARARPPAGADP